MENELKNSFRTGYSKGIGFGLFLMLIGMLFLGFNFGLIPMNLKSILITWPAFFILVGILSLVKRNFISSYLFLFLGVFFIIPKIMPELEGNFFEIYWPVLLIGVGVLILLQKLFGPKCSTDNCKGEWSNYQHKHHHYSKYSNNKGGFSKNSVFGGGDHIVLDEEFKGGEMNAVFGGITLDLRRTNLPAGETFLEANAVFGGITIYVPGEWLVETQMDSVFGGFQDNRITKDSIDTTRKLIITGSCVFGGGELKN